MQLPSSFVIYDFETTGLDTSTCYVTEMCAVRFDRGVETARLDCLIRLPCKLPEKIIEITGITDAMLEERGIEEKDAVRMLSALQDGTRLVGHNITRYDNHILARLQDKHNQTRTMSAHDIDTAALYKAALLKSRPKVGESMTDFQDRILRVVSPLKYNLPLCYKSLTGKEPDGAHRARADVGMVQEVLPRLVALHEAYFNGHTHV